MTKEDIDMITMEMKVFQKKKEINKNFIDELQEKLTDENGLKVDECSQLIHNSPLRIKYRKIRRLDGDHMAYGLGYKDIAVEFYVENECMH